MDLIHINRLILKKRKQWGLDAERLINKTGCEIIFSLIQMCQT